MTNDELLSKTISYLRFPLIIGVVFIHNDISSITIQGVEYTFNNPDWYYHLINFFSQVLPRISAPLFFFMSGFLFFYKCDFSVETYKRKLKSRMRTLLIPYLIWNFIGFLWFSVKHFPLASMFPRVAQAEYSLLTFFKCFWVYSGNPDEMALYPINYPFWFIRDLMVVVLLTPIIYWLIKHLKFAFILLVGICWYGDFWWKVPGLSSATVFFFSCGAYFSINKENVVSLFRKATFVPIVYLMVAIIDTATKGAVYNPYIHKLGILLGIVSAFIIVAHYLEKGKISASKFLSDGSFFVFALHALFMSEYMKVLFKVLQPESPYLLAFFYFFVPITTILICLGLYKVLRKNFPTFTALLTGGR